MNSLFFKRRSIRNFQDKKVDKSLIQEILKAGMVAPSAVSSRPWHIIVIDDKEILKKIPTVHPYATMVPKASHVILVCGNTEDMRSEAWWPQDCSALTENMLLAIADLGLGGVWLGCYPRGDRVTGLKELLNLPENIIPFSLIPVGYPLEDKPLNDFYDENRVHWNQW